MSCNLRAHRVMSESFIRRRRFKISNSIENALNKNARPGRDAQPVERAAIVGLTRRSVSRNDSGDVCAMRVFVGTVG